MCERKKTTEESIEERISRMDREIGVVSDGIMKVFAQFEELSSTVPTLGSEPVEVDPNDPRIIEGKSNDS